MKFFDEFYTKINESLVTLETESSVAVEVIVFFLSVDLSYLKKDC